MRRRTILGILLLSALLLAACGGTPGKEEVGDVGGTSLVAEVGEGEVKVGEPAPYFRLPAQNGQILDLNELDGKAVIVNFWATWCGPCRIEMPELQAAYDSFNDDGLEIIGVEISTSGNESESQTFLQEVGVSFPTFRDEDEIMQDRYVKRPALPTTVFIDREGVVRFVQIGPMTEAFIEEQLNDLGF